MARLQQRHAFLDLRTPPSDLGDSSLAVMPLPAGFDCVILAGGRGTRMSPVTDHIPKALIPVRGTPFAAHQLAWLAEQGVTRVVYCIGYKGELIREYVGDGKRWGLSVVYVDEGEERKGTAGALRLGLDAGALGSTFFTLYGDAYLPIELAPVWHAFDRRGSPALMTVFRNEGRWDASNVVFRDGMVELYQKGTRNTNMEYIDYGVSILGSTLIESLVPPNMIVDLAEVFHGLSKRRLLAGFEVTERFYEVGSPAGLLELESYLAARETAPPDGSS